MLLLLLLLLLWFLSENTWGGGGYLQGGRVTPARGLTLGGGQKIAQVYKQNFTGRVTSSTWDNLMRISQSKGLETIRKLTRVVRSMTDVSVTLRPPCWRPSKGHQHGVSIQSSINLYETLFRITPE